MGATPSEPQQSPDDERRIEIAATEPDTSEPPKAGSPPAEPLDSPPRPGAEALDRTARYLLGPTAFCA